MGANVYTSLTIGVRIERSDFLLDTDGVLSCPSPLHPPSPGPFCSTCGTKFQPKVVSTPTDAFRTWAIPYANTRGWVGSVMRMDYSEIWEALFEKYPKSLAVHRVQAVQSSEDRKNKDMALALGYEVSQMSGDDYDYTYGRSASRVESVSLYRVLELEGNFRTETAGLGLEFRKIELFSTIYWSV